MKGAKSTSRKDSGRVRDLERAIWDRTNRSSSFALPEDKASTLTGKVLKLSATLHCVAQKDIKDTVFFGP